MFRKYNKQKNRGKNWRSEYVSHRWGWHDSQVSHVKGGNASVGRGTAFTATHIPFSHEAPERRVHPIAGPPLIRFPLFLTTFFLLFVFFEHQVYILDVLGIFFFILFFPQFENNTGHPIRLGAWLPDIWVPWKPPMKHSFIFLTFLLQVFFNMYFLDIEL